MKRTLNIKNTAALAIACALAFSPAAGAAGYSSLSASIARCAVENSLKKIAVLDFAAKGGTEKSETEYVAEKMGVQLAGSKTVALIERSLLEKIMKETGLSSAAGGDGDRLEALKNMLSVDAVVTGVVFADGEKLKVFVRLIEIKTGRVLLAAEGEAARLPPDLFGGRSGDMVPPEVPFPELPAAWNDPGPAASRTAFRDAVSGSGDQSCSGRRRLLDRLNAELVDAKAWYWAARMKTPGFSMRTLTKNPGSEIGDPEVKARFYKLLASYYKAGTSVPFDQEKKAKVADLIKLETDVSDQCGRY